ncbi:uncharacterized protein BJ171DRAFT_122375 [Polychytrium aggregatum]|uniref:uncharacterized protein n=1 Tax=Polychytrium aggregatum TaxID=110093 RepID=UPI0022FDB936|nr:uncharacterized protein BJ171DRAFT_122375 [Polychytrium aggregatum]KAI9204284.1 hypothetical protein BJ171DRAFT_122375 [Polychytrium aggregatum]
MYTFFLFSFWNWIPIGFSISPLHPASPFGFYLATLFFLRLWCSFDCSSSQYRAMTTFPLALSVHAVMDRVSGSGPQPGSFLVYLGSVDLTPEWPSPVWRRPQSLIAGHSSITHCGCPSIDQCGGTHVPNPSTAIAFYPTSPPMSIEIHGASSTRPRPPPPAQQKRKNYPIFIFRLLFFCLCVCLCVCSCRFELDCDVSLPQLSSGRLRSHDSRCPICVHFALFSSPFSVCFVLFCVSDCVLSSICTISFSPAFAPQSTGGRGDSVLHLSLLIEYASLIHQK